MTTAAALSPDNRADILLAIYLVMTFATCAVLWVHEHRWDQHDDALHAHTQQLALLAGRLQSLADYLDVDINDPVADDSPEAEEQNAPVSTSAQVNPEEQPGDDTPTAETPLAPDTQPDHIAIQVQSALLERHELMTPETAEKQRAARAAWVEAQIAKFEYTGGRK